MNKTELGESASHSRKAKGSIVGVVTLVAAMALSGCVQLNQLTLYRGGSGWRQDQAAAAEKSLANGDYVEALALLRRGLNGTPVDADYAKKLAEKQPAFAVELPRALSEKADTASDKQGLFALLSDIDLARTNQIANAGLLDAAEKHVNAVAYDGNASGRFNFLLSDDYTKFEALTRPDADGIIFRRSLQKFAAEPDTLESQAVLRRVKGQPRSSPEVQAVEKSLGARQFTRLELAGALSEVFPEFAQAELEKMTAYISVQMDEVDRLFQDDIVAMLASRDKSIKIDQAGRPGAFVVKVRRLQYEERQLPEKQETIIYPDYKVDIAKAVMLMPRNATYMYEVVSGGIEISYGFLITIERGGNKLSEDVVRDRISDTYTTCRNQRVQNVFGGTQAANFVANSDQQSRCSERYTPSMLELRNRALRKLTDTVSANAEIQKVTRK